MNRVLVLVEGQTEEAFVQQVLGPWLWPSGIALEATVSASRRSAAHGRFKGGALSYQRVAFQVRRLLRDSGARLVTTMIDLYRLPGDFPGWATCPAGPGAGRAEHLERCFSEDIGHDRFRPYLSVHEFEALLFAGLDACAEVFRSQDAVASLHVQRASYPTAEDVDREQPPSGRILRAVPSFQKVSDGPIATALIGLPQLRRECPHFDSWVRDLERAGAPTPLSSAG